MKNPKAQFVVAAVLLLPFAAAWAAFVDGVETFDGSVKDTDTWEEWIMDGIYGSVTQNDALTIESCADYTAKTVTVGIGQAVSVEVHYANPSEVYGIANLVLTDNSEGTAMSTGSEANSLFISFDEHWGTVSGGHARPAPLGWLNLGFFDGVPPSPNAVILELARLSATSAHCSAYDLDWNPIGSFAMTTPAMPEELYISLHVCHDMPYTFDNVMILDLPPETMPVFVDINPGSCSNIVNFKSNAVLPVAVLGFEGFDVGMIDPASIRLNGAAPVSSGSDDVGCAAGGVDYDVYTVLNEAHVFIDPFPFTLNQTWVEPFSIIVTDVTGTMIYSEGDDYTINQIRDQVEITCTTLGTMFPNISNGQNLLVDYQYYVETVSIPREDCSDGITDLVLRFKTRDVVETLGDVQRDDVIPLSLTGVLYDGTPIEGADSVTLKGGPKNKTKPHKK
jgi:hypothetical protein